MASPEGMASRQVDISNEVPLYIYFSCRHEGYKPSEGKRCVQIPGPKEFLRKKSQNFVYYVELNIFHGISKLLRNYYDICKSFTYFLFNLKKSRVNQHLYQPSKQSAKTGLSLYQNKCFEKTQKSHYNKEKHISMFMIRLIGINLWYISVFSIINKRSKIKGVPGISEEFDKIGCRIHEIFLPNFKKIVHWYLQMFYSEKKEKK